MNGPLGYNEPRSYEYFFGDYPMLGVKPNGSVLLENKSRSKSDPQVTDPPFLFQRLAIMP